MHGIFGDAVSKGKSVVWQSLRFPVREGNERTRITGTGEREKIRGTRQNGLVFIVRSPEAAILALHCHRAVTEIKEKHTSAGSIGFLPRLPRNHYPGLRSRWISFPASMLALPNE